MEVLIALAGAAFAISAGALVAALKAYGAEKGRNLAIREDLDSVHRQLELMRSEFRIAEARVAAVHGHRFAAELEVLRELWDRMVEFQAAGDKVWYEGIRVGDASEASKEFQEKVSTLDDRIRRLAPFVPREIHVALLKAQLPIREMAAHLTRPRYRDPEAVKGFLDEQLPQVWQGMKELEDAVRKRLWSDDSALQGLMAD